MARKQMWFGTLDRMRWIDAPLRGADMSPEGWGAGSTLLSGGAAARMSWGTHKKYVFEWPDSTDRRMAQLLKSYRDGTFGRGLLYFVDPLTYDQNILPARWANPSMSLGEEGPGLVQGIYPSEVTTVGGETLDLPVVSAFYNLSAVTPGYRGDSETLFLPIPPGYTLHLGAIYSYTGNARLFVTPVNSDGSLGTAVALTALSTSATNIVPQTFTGGKGVRLWLGTTASGASTATLTALTARLSPSGTVNTGGPWIGGMGHSGCAFDPSIAPTWIANTGLNGGQIGCAATFIEVGDWA